MGGITYLICQITSPHQGKYLTPPPPPPAKYVFQILVVDIYGGNLPKIIDSEKQKNELKVDSAKNLPKITESEKQKNELKVDSVQRKK